MYFIKADDAELAIRTAVKLIKNGPTHHKTPRALEAFKEYSKTAKFPKPDVFEEFKEGLLKNWKGLDEATAKKSMEHVHEMIKIDKKNASLAVGALAPNKVHAAENTHRLLVKIGDSKTAEDYKKKAKDMYPYSTYFEGAKKDIK